MGRVLKWTVMAKGKRSVYPLWHSCPQSISLYHNVHQCYPSYTTHTLLQFIVWQLVSTSSRSHHQAKHNMYMNRNCSDRKTLPLSITLSTNTRQSVHWIQWHLGHFLYRNNYYKGHRNHGQYHYSSHIWHKIYRLKIETPKYTCLWSVFQEGWIYPIKTNFNWYKIIL